MKKRTGTIYHSLATLTRKRLTGKVPVCLLIIFALLIVASSGKENLGQNKTVKTSAKDGALSANNGAMLAHITALLADKAPLLADKAPLLANEAPLSVTKP